MPSKWKIFTRTLIIYFLLNQTANLVNSTDPGGGNESDLIPITCCIKHQRSFFGYESTKSETITTFTPKQGYGFNKVQSPFDTMLLSCFCCDKTVWETSDATKYANKVEFDENTKTLTIHLPGDKTKKFKEGDWHQRNWNISSSYVGLELNINSKTSTEQWTYKENNKIHTYEAKDNNKIYMVFETNKGSCIFDCCNSQCCNSNCWPGFLVILKYLFCCCCYPCCKSEDIEVWETTDPKLYASKVEFDENTNTTTITLADGKTKKFQKTGGGCCGGDTQWNEVVKVNSSDQGDEGALGTSESGAKASTTTNGTSAGQPSSSLRSTPTAGSS